MCVGMRHSSLSKIISEAGTSISYDIVSFMWSVLLRSIMRGGGMV